MARTTHFRASNRLRFERSMVNTLNRVYVALVLVIVAAVFCTLAPSRPGTLGPLTPGEVESVVTLPEVIVTAPRRKPTLDGVARTR